ncbi:MAG: TetR/AcrR family transcriptional regulator [Pseudomonadota bacterium]
MSAKISTADKILDSSRQLFNARGYAATSLNDIASSVGISKGNLTYHYPTKRALAQRLIASARQAARERRLNLESGDVADDYVEHLLFAMDMTWNHRFLLRDRREFAEELGGPDSELTADFAELHTLIQRISAAGLFRKGAVTDYAVLARSIWIVSRYWMDYLREFEGQQEVTWADQESGIRQHFAILLPCLTAAARKRFEAALTRAIEQQQSSDPRPEPGTEATRA